MQINIRSILKNLKAAVLGGAIVVVGVIAGLTAYQRYEASKNPNIKAEPKEPTAPKSRIKAELLGSPADLFAPAADALIKTFSDGVKVELGSVKDSKTAAGLVTIPAQGGGTAFQALVRLDGTCTPLECANLRATTAIMGKTNQMTPATMEFSINKKGAGKDEYAAAFHVGGQEGAYFLNKFGAPTGDALAKLYSDISPADLSVATTASRAAMAVEAANKASRALAQQGKFVQQPQNAESVMGDRATVYQRVAKGSMPAKIVVKKTFEGEAFGSDGLTLQFELEKDKPLSMLDIGKAMLAAIHNTYRVDNFSKHSRDDQLRLTTAAGAVMVREAMSDDAKDGVAHIAFGSVDVRGFDLNDTPRMLEQALANAPGIGKVESEAKEMGRQLVEKTKKQQEETEMLRQKELERKANGYDQLGLPNPDQPFKGKTWGDIEKGFRPGMR
jgi:hypothetical protein